MPTDTTSYAEQRRQMEARRARAILAADRYAARVRAAVWLGALAWYGVGILLFLLSYHLAGDWAAVAFWGGLVTCLAGPFFTWVVAIVLGQDSGIWT